MKFDQLFKVDIGNAVAVSQHEGFIADKILHALDPPAGHGIQAGIHDRDLPRLGDVVVNDRMIGIGEVECDIGMVQIIVCKILLDDMLLVARADDEFVVSITGIILHDMPEDRLPADLNHRLWL